MSACPQCDGLAQGQDVQTPADYRNLARQLAQRVDAGDLALIRADCPLADLFLPVWPGDVLVHEFQCTACRRRFKLLADTYHGRVEWKALAQGNTGAAVDLD